MRKIFSVVLCFVMLFSNTFQSNIVFAETLSVAPIVSEVTITNNYIKSDTIYVTGLMGGDKIKIYNAATEGKVIGTATVGTKNTFVTVTIAQVGVDAGSLYITNTSNGKGESVRSKIPYDAEPVSDEPTSENITIINNANKPDTIYVTGLAPGDVIKMYKAKTGGNALISATAKSNSTDATLSISQLGSSEGTVYITNTTKGMHESNRVPAVFSAEAYSVKLSSSNVTITNSVGKSDVIYAYGLAPKDVIKIYSAATEGKLLGTATVASNRTDANVMLSQLGVNAGSIYISVTSPGLVESLRTKVDFLEEGETESIQASNVVITNNIGVADTIYVKGLASGDKVNVYNTISGGKLLGSATVASSKSEVTVSISQLGTSAGSVYISVTSTGMLEGPRVKVNYTEEYKSRDVSAEDIIVTNNAGKADIILVSGVSKDDVINVYRYATGGTKLGSSTVTGDSMEATVSVSQLGTTEGTIYVAITSKNHLESNRILVSYLAEGTSSTLEASSIIVSNNAGKPDMVYISNLTAGDVLNVYDATSGGNLLGSGTVGTSSTDITISIPQLNISAGSIYISRTSIGKSATARVKVSYLAESQSSTLNAESVVVTNNSGKSDTVQVLGLSDNQIVNVYDAISGGNLLGTATVAQYGTSVTISISQLGASAGNIYVSLTETNKITGPRVTVSYSAESQSTNVTASNVTVTNNSVIADSLYIPGLDGGDVINVYNAASGGNLLGSGVVGISSTDITISIPQLGTSAGSVYISKTSTSKTESKRVEVAYSSESQSRTLNSENIVVTNNSGKADTVEVVGVSDNEVVNVYDSLSGGNLLGTATVAQYGTAVTITISQLGTSAGNVYVSLTETNKLEGSRVKIAYLAQSQTTAVNVSDVTVTNNASVADTVKVRGLTTGDIVNVYDSSVGGKLLGTGTVVASSSTVTISIDQLGVIAGSIYISVTSDGKLASERIIVDYTSESASNTIEAENIIITNNIHSSDTVKVVGLSPGDIINIYSLAIDGDLLGTGTVTANSTEVTISIAQLGSSSGSIYVSNTTLRKGESDRIKADYTAEPVSVVLDAGNIVIINNAGVDDLIQVKGLSANDVVKVYNAATNGSLIGTATVGTYGTDATVTINQLGGNAGNVYVSVTSTNKGESSRTQVGFASEAKSIAPIESNVSITNNLGINSTITVSGVTGNDIIKAYDAALGGNLLGAATVSSNDTEATISVTKLAPEGGSVYVSIISTGKLESDRTTANYTAKIVSSAPNVNSVTVVNNAKIQDTVKLIGLQPNDVVRVYDSAIGGNLLGSAIVSSSSANVTLTIAQLGVAGGNIYVSVKSTGKTESSRTTIAFKGEAQSDAPVAGYTTIINNSGLPDTITVTGLTTYDVVNVYSAATGGVELGTATVTNGDSKVIISIAQLGSNAGSVYVSVTRNGKTESNRTQVNYIAESTAPVEGNIVIVNNAVIEDTITVKGLTSNDVVKVYDAAGNGQLLGAAIVTSNSTETTITISQLTSTMGSVYISVTNFGRSESSKTKVDYLAEQSSNAIYVGNVSITNNKRSDSIDDIITVNNLSSNYVIRVYDAASGGNLIGIAAVSSGGTTVTITISELSTGAGSVYMTVTIPGKKESSRTKVDYVSQS